MQQGSIDVIAVPFEPRNLIERLASWLIRPRRISTVIYYLDGEYGSPQRFHLGPGDSHTFTFERTDDQA